MQVSISRLKGLIGSCAIIAPALHTATDVAEWFMGGYSPSLLWVNYLSFLIMPFLLIGLYAVQLPRIGALGLLGAVLYGTSFIYFSHTTLYALIEAVPDYESLWQRLGTMYTVNGAVMIAGGAAFGIGTYRAGQFASWTSLVFTAGIGLNFLLALLNAPEQLQTVGSLVRNMGLIGMGLELLRKPTKLQEL